MGGGVEVRVISYFVTVRLLLSNKTSTVLVLLGNRLEVFIVVLMVNLSFWFMLACSSIPVLFFMRLFTPLDFLAKILVIWNLIPMTRSVLCAQPRSKSPVGAVGYGVGVL